MKLYGEFVDHCPALRHAPKGKARSGISENAPNKGVSHMTDDEIIKRYTSIAEFISLCFSNNVEVVVHDVRKDLKRSVVGIYNNHVSGRTLGAPFTKLGIRFLQEELYRDREHICNYEGVTANGVAVRASTFFIKNEAGEVIGCLCVNVDLSSYTHAANILNELIRFGLDQDNLPKRASRYTEDFPRTASDMTAQIIAQYCAQNNKRSDSLSSGDKYEVICRLDKAGLFSFKGSIGDVALSLKLSEPTIYRYLKKVRKEKVHAEGDFHLKRASGDGTVLPGGTPPGSAVHIGATGNKSGKRRNARVVRGAG